MSDVNYADPCEVTRASCHLMYGQAPFLSADRSLVAPAPYIGINLPSNWKVRFVGHVCPGTLDVLPGMWESVWLEMCES